MMSPHKPSSTKMITPARLLILSLATACLLISCAAPKTSKGFLDMDGDGHAETVTVLNRPRDQQMVLLHLQKIEASQKIQELAKQSDDSLKLLYNANSASAAEKLASRYVNRRTLVKLRSSRSWI